MYIQIQEQLKEMLLNGTLKANALVPSKHEFGEKLKVSCLPVRKSYTERDRVHVGGNVYSTKLHDSLKIIKRRLVPVEHRNRWTQRT